MKWWIISDTHFGHDKIVKFCDRPAEHSGITLSNIRSLVKKDDVLIHIGDFCWGNDAHWHEVFMEACPSTRWLIRGNHDRKSNSWYLEHGWDVVADKTSLRMYGENIIFTHIPIFCEGDYVNVHGHLHNTQHHTELETDHRNRLFCIEHIYRPVDLRRMVENYATVKKEHADKPITTDK